MNQSAAHQALVGKILEAFGAHPCILLRRRTVGLLQTKSAKGTQTRKIKVGQDGEADLDGIWKRHLHVSRVINPNGFNPVTQESDVTVGLHLAIEVKTGKAVQSADQIRWAAAWQAMGGVYILARCVDDVYLALKRHDLAEHGPSV
jgi:hypothetical protein